MTRTARLGKTQEICPSFKGDQHKVIGAIKISKELDLIKLNLYLSDNSIYRLVIDDFRQTEARYAKKNIDIPGKTHINCVYDTTLDIINKKTVSRPIVEREPKPEPVRVEKEEETSLFEETQPETPEENTPLVEVEPEVVTPKEPHEKKKKEEKTFEQISIFDIDDDDE